MLVAFLHLTLGIELAPYFGGCSGITRAQESISCQGTHTSPTKHPCCLASADYLLKPLGYHHSCWAQSWLLVPAKHDVPYVHTELQLVRSQSSLQSTKLGLGSGFYHPADSQSLWPLFSLWGLGSGALGILGVVLGTGDPCLPSLSRADPCVSCSGSLNCPPTAIQPSFMLHVVTQPWGPWLHGTCPHMAQGGPVVPRHFQPALLDPQAAHSSLTPRT